MLGLQRPAAYQPQTMSDVSCDRLAAISIVLTVLVLQFVLLQGVTADCRYDVECIQALICLGFAHLAFYQSADMFIALQQQLSQCSGLLTRCTRQINVVPGPCL